MHRLYSGATVGTDAAIKSFSVAFLGFVIKMSVQMLQELQNRRKPIEPILSQLENNVDGSVLQRRGAFGSNGRRREHVSAEVLS